MKVRLFGVLLVAGILAGIVVFASACGDDNNSLGGEPVPTDTAPATVTPTFTQTPLGTPTGTAATPIMTQTPLGTPTGTAG